MGCHSQLPGLQGRDPLPQLIHPPTAECSRQGRWVRRARGEQLVWGSRPAGKAWAPSTAWSTCGRARSGSLVGGTLAEAGSPASRTTSTRGPSRCCCRPSSCRWHGGPSAGARKDPSPAAAAQGRKPLPPPRARARAALQAAAPRSGPTSRARVGRCRTYIQHLGQNGYRVGPGWVRGGSGVGPG